MRRVAIRSAVFFILQGNAIGGEGEDAMVTDRPDFTESSAVVPAGVLQTEMGFGWSGDGEEEADLYTVPGVLLRLGIGGGIEARLASAYLLRRTEQAGDGSTTGGLAGVMVGTKVYLIDRDNGPAELAVLGHVHIPAGGNRFTSRGFEPEVIVAASREINESAGVGANLGGHWDSAAENMIFLFSVSAGVGLPGGIGVFAEYFGLLSERLSPSNNLDVGFTFPPAPFLQFDISGGVSTVGPTPSYFAGAGVSVRVGD